MGGEAGSTLVPEFTCNLCGARNRKAAPFPREEPTCRSCGSNVRMRALLRALSLELFGAALALPEFPTVKSLRGIGTSDSPQYAARLAEKFDYRNTFFDREPRFDLTRPDEREFGAHDFLLSSEVLEHVAPPVEAALENAARLLKPAGALFMTVPYSLEAVTRERFPDLYEWGIARVGERDVLVNRTRSGELQVFDELIFHLSFGQPALEMREFSERDLRCLLLAAGFPEVRIFSDEDPLFGVFHAEACSFPIVARKGPFALTSEAAREIVEQWRGVRRTHDETIARLMRSWWFRAGRKLRLY